MKEKTKRHTSLLIIKETYSNNILDPFIMDIFIVIATAETEDGRCEDDNLQC